MFPSVLSFEPTKSSIGALNIIVKSISKSSKVSHLAENLVWPLAFAQVPIIQVFVLNVSGVSWKKNQIRDQLGCQKNQHFRVLAPWIWFPAPERESECDFWNPCCQYHISYNTFWVLDPLPRRFLVLFANCFFLALPDSPGSSSGDLARPCRRRNMI